MNVDVSFISPFIYDWKTIGQWFWMYKPYTYVDGFIIRICGVYFNVREHGATEKLIAIAQNK